MDTFQQIKESTAVNLEKFNSAVLAYRAEPDFTTVDFMNEAKAGLANSLKELITHTDALPFYKGHDMYKFDKFSVIPSEDIYDGIYIGFNKSGYVVLDVNGARSMKNIDTLYSLDLTQFATQLLSLFS